MRELFAKAITIKIKKRKNNNNNTIIPNQQTKIEIDINCNKRSVIIAFSDCVKTCLMNNILLQKQELIFIIRKSLNQYPNIKAQTSDDIQPKEKYEDNTVVFDNMLLSEQKSNINLFFTRGRHNSFDIYYISQSYFHLSKNSIRNNSSLSIFFKETQRDIIFYFLI